MVQLCATGRVKHTAYVQLESALVGLDGHLDREGCRRGSSAPKAMRKSQAEPLC